jgi:hypothetical protein
VRVLTKEGASRLLNVDDLDIFVNELADRLPPVAGPYSIPRDSGEKTALSRLIDYLLLRNSSACVYVSGWSVWPSSENLDLFYGYRRSIGETRFLIEAPAHIFESTEHDALVSILCMVFYFIWDAWVFDAGGNALVRISHDEWLEIRAGDDEAKKEFASELDKFGMHLLAH